MNKKIKSALISVYYKDGLAPVINILSELGITIYSTGGTREFIEQMGIAVTPVEDITSYPSILGGRVKTLHPAVLGGILARRNNEKDVEEVKQFNLREMDLVIVDLYPFEETVASAAGEKQIIEKIDVGGPTMIRSAAKNFEDVTVVAARKDYAALETILRDQKGETTLQQRKDFAAKAFEVVAHYDVAIAKYFNPSSPLSSSKNPLYFFESVQNPAPLRYGENPHQNAIFYGDLSHVFEQMHGKELSYNNLVDVDAAHQLISEFRIISTEGKGTPPATFAIIKHTNVCGIAQKPTVYAAWKAALAGDPESAFGGVLVCNQGIDLQTAEAITEIFFEVLLAPSFDADALKILQSKKNRILLKHKSTDDPSVKKIPGNMYRSLLNGVLMQDTDKGNYAEWTEAGGKESSPAERHDLEFANLVCKHLKSNAIALVKDRQLIGKGCGQTSRIDSLRQAIEKSHQFDFDLNGAVMASDAFFPFDDCVKMGHQAGIACFIQPGGSIRDNDSIAYCQQHKLVMVLTKMRHFKH
jgi:phosphoribosylaminoimidazolecarboxamide formyltransferase / IMP cyclohydrolase